VFRRRLRYLLDTRILIWALIDTECLPQRYVYALRSKYNEIFFSAASIWEIATIHEATYWAPGFTALEIGEAARATGFIELPVRSDAAAKVPTLPPIHDDPFDRILIAQAMIEPARFLTTDEYLNNYSDIVDVVKRETDPLFRRYGAFPATAR
jgi:PIN domain nuclease of toxin-antitoxin system